MAWRPAPREDTREPGHAPRGVRPRWPVPPCSMPRPALAPSPAPPAPCSGKGTALPCRQHHPASQGGRRGLSLTAEVAATQPELPRRPWQLHGHRLRPAAQASGPQPLQASLPAVASCRAPASLLDADEPVPRPAGPGQRCTRLRLGPPMGLMRIHSWECPRQMKQEGTGVVPAFCLKSGIILKNNI